MNGVPENERDFVLDAVDARIVRGSSEPSWVTLNSENVLDTGSLRSGDRIAPAAAEEVEQHDRRKRRRGVVGNCRKRRTPWQKHTSTSSRDARSCKLGDTLSGMAGHAFRRDGKPADGVHDRAARRVALSSWEP